MRPFPLTSLTQGINHLRVKGAADPGSLYDLVNAYINQEGTVLPRPGTLHIGILPNDGGINTTATAITITDAGSGYTNGTHTGVALTDVSSSGSGAEATIVVSGGEVTSITVTTSGSGYSIGDTISATIGSGTGFVGTVKYVTTTAGLAYFDGDLHTFSTSYGQLSSPFYLDTLVYPQTAGNVAVPPYELETIWFAQPFMGFLYVVAEFTDGNIYHYWLQNEGEWIAETVYTDTSIVTPTTDNINGLAYQATRVLPANPTWTPNQVIATVSGAGIATGSITDAGSGYDGGGTHTYTAVPLTGGHGTGATATVVITSGEVTSVTITPTSAGTGYEEGDELSANKANLGNNGGSGFEWTVSTIATVTNILVPMIEPTVANGYYYVPTIYEYAPAVAGTVLNVATGSTEPTWPTTFGGQVDDAGDYLQYTNSALVAAGGTPNLLSTTITDRYGDSSTVAGLTATSTSVNTSALPLVIGALAPWKGGHTYALGSIVTPTSTQGAYINTVFNGSFYQSGAASETGWDFNVSGGTGGTWAVKDSTIYGYSLGEAYISSEATTYSCQQNSEYYGTVAPGTEVTATAIYNYSGSDSVFILQFGIQWYESDAETLISTTWGNGGNGSNVGGWTNTGGGGGYVTISVTGTAPSNAAYAGIVFKGDAGSTPNGSAAITNINWNLSTASASTQLIYQVTEIGSYTASNAPAGAIVQGVSGQTEPTWPNNVSGTVTDGQLIWTAIGSSVITWTGYPIMQSGSSEPSTTDVAGVWPVLPGQNVWDGSSVPLTINGIQPPYTPAEVSGQQIWAGGFIWTCISRQITDTNCPNTNSVATGASHIFAGSNDIASYSAAVNPTDWTTPDNAGYLPTGLNSYGANPVSAIGLYRSNLMVFNSGGYQMWQIDPDPANMALLDAQPIGTDFVRSLQTVGTDMILLTPLGIRNVGMTGATVNMQTGMFGQPIDDIIQSEITALGLGSGDASTSAYPLSLYYPARGQYWLIFEDQVLVGTINQPGKPQWSRYIFPQAITDWTLWGDDLYLRTSENYVWKVDYTQIADDVTTGTVSVTAVVGDDGYAYTDGSIPGIDAADQTAVTFSGNSIPSPLNSVDTFYIRSVNGGGGSPPYSGPPYTLGIAASEGGSIITDYVSGSCTMEWTDTIDIVCDSIAQVQGVLEYTGNLGLADGDTLDLVQDASTWPIYGESSPLTVYIQNYSYASGVTSFNVAATADGTPYFLLAGGCNATYSSTSDIDVTGAIVASGGIVYSTPTSYITTGQTVEFTGSPPSPLETDTEYTLTSVGDNGYTVYSSGTEVVLTTVGDGFDISLVDGGADGTGTTTIEESSVWYVVTNIATTNPVAIGYSELELSSDTGYVPYTSASTYTINAAYNDGGYWAFELSGVTFGTFNYDTIDGASIINLLLIPAESDEILLTVDGDVAQDYFTYLYWDIGGGDAVTLESADATYIYSDGESSWEWSSGKSGPTSGTISCAVAKGSLADGVLWQASLTIGSKEVGGVTQYGYSTTSNIGSLAALTFTADLVNSTAFPAGATLGEPYGYLVLQSGGTSGLTYNQECTFSGADLPSVSSGDLDSGTWYIVYISAPGPSNYIEVSSSSEGTPVSVTSDGSGVMAADITPTVALSTPGGAYGYLEVTSGTPPAQGTTLTTGASTPSDLAENTEYYVYSSSGSIITLALDSDETPYNTIVETGNGYDMSYAQTENATLVTVEPVPGYIEVSGGTVPVVGQIVQFDDFDPSSMPPFEADTNYYINSVTPVGLGTYDFTVNYPPSSGGTQQNPTVNGTMGMITGSAGSSVPFDSWIWWPWLDCGDIGVDKLFNSFHIAGTGDCQVSFGWNENDLTAFTPFYDLGLADTIPDFPIGLAMTAKTISPYLYFAGPQTWSLEAFVIYVQDLGLS